MWHMVASYSATHVDAQGRAVVVWSYIRPLTTDAESVHVMRLMDT